MNLRDNQRHAFEQASDEALRIQRDLQAARGGLRHAGATAPQPAVLRWLRTHLLAVIVASLLVAVLLATLL